MTVAYDIDVFAEDYKTAREKFLSACSQRPGKLRQFTNPHCRYGEQELTTDVFRLGTESAHKMLVIISATHGVEGFGGSAAQINWLRHEPDPEPDTAIVLIHALNPFGFAHCRRVDENNIDLNRNFVDFTDVPANDGYRQLATALQPEIWDEASRNQSQKRIEAYRNLHGQQQVEKAISGGQYQFPDGLFYGGNAPSWSRQTIETIIADFGIGQLTQCCVIDIHSGLGPYGYGEIICDHLPGSAGTQLARHWFGDSVTEPLAGTSTSVPKCGLLDYAWHQAFGDKGCYVTLEFGTYPVAQMFAALQEENYYWQQWQKGEISRQKMQKINQNLRHFFYPAKRDWMEMVLFRSSQVIAQALAGLSED